VSHVDSPLKVAAGEFEVGQVPHVAAGAVSTSPTAIEGLAEAQKLAAVAGQEVAAWEHTVGAGALGPAARGSAKVPEFAAEDALSRAVEAASSAGPSTMVQAIKEGLVEAWFKPDTAEEWAAASACS
jgi:hypothetical protein